MTEKEQIKAEIEGRIALAEKCAEAACEKNLHSALEANEMLIRQYKSLLAFIESLPEEKPSEDLNKLIQKWDRIDINTVLKVKVKATGKVIDGFYDGRGHFDHFIDHDVFDRYSIDEVELMPDEEPSKDLDEAVEKHINEALFKWSYDDEDGIEQYVHDAFIAGAEWQKEQMMKDAVEGEVIYDLGRFFRIKSECIDGAKYKVGSWVKLIIVKED